MKTNTSIKANINQVCGRIISEPVFRTIEDKALLTFSLLYNTVQKTDKDGSNANFIDVEIWNEAATMFNDMISKGLEILINGAFVQKRFVTKTGKRASKFIFAAGYLSITDINYAPVPLANKSNAMEQLEKAA